MNKVFKYGKAICYSGYRDGQSPTAKCPTREQIEEDIMILHNEGYIYLRMYDPNEHARMVLDVIKDKKLPMKCLIGVDSFAEASNPESAIGALEFTEEEISKNIKRNDAEIERLINLVNEYEDQIIAVSIGNENTPLWATRPVSEERLIEHAKRLKEALDKPVTYCEGTYEWKSLTKLAECLDFISIHSYPMHGCILLENALEANQRDYNETKAVYPDKEVVFTEMGWTTRESSHMIPGQGSVENQKIYITKLCDWLDEKQIIGFLFEAFDETWKASSPEKGECNWGLHYMNRMRKWE